MLVPSPNVAGDHQTRNAEALAGAGAAVLLAEPDLTPEALVARVLGLLGDDAALGRMAAAGGAVGAADPAADVIARAILAEIDPP